MRDSEEYHRAAREAKRHLAEHPTTSVSHGSTVAHYLAAQHYRETAGGAKARPTESESTPTERPAPLIVVGVDGSRFGREALRWALAEAADRDCEVRAVLVRRSPRRVDPSRGGTVTDESTRGLRDTVAAVVGARAEPRLRAEVVAGSVGETLCAAARDAQLLVLGSRGRGHFAQAVLGSVARYCVQRAPCPVVVVPGALAAVGAEHTRDEERG